MKNLLNGINWLVMYFVTGYSLFSDWQAWALTLSYVISIAIIEEHTKIEMGKKITPIVDNIERKFNDIASRRTPPPY